MVSFVVVVQWPVAIHFFSTTDFQVHLLAFPMVLIPCIVCGLLSADDQWLHHPLFTGGRFLGHIFSLALEESLSLLAAEVVYQVIVLVYTE